MPLDRGRDGGGASVRGFLHVDVKVVIGEHRTADRRDADRLFLNAQFLDRFHQDAVDDAVAAARDSSETACR